MFSRRAFLHHGVAFAATGAAEARAGDASASKAAATPSRTLLVAHPAFQLHVPGPGHPESPARLQVIDAALADPSFAALLRETAPLRNDIDAAILLVHSAAHLQHIASIADDSARLPYALDHDTILSAGSLEAARRAVGAGLLAVDCVMQKRDGVTNAFCQLRPPGHHAERERAMGFCFFNTIAVAAAYAKVRHAVTRLAIVDFDVHHGNGTQGIFWSDPNVFYGSTHQMPLFPGTGAVSETGAGNIFNAPLVKGDDGERFREAMADRILPALDAFGPELILISAGFDAHLHDPLAGLRLREADFEWITQKLVEAAHKHCGGRIVSFLEGGYRLDALAVSAAIHVQTLMQSA